MIRLTRRKSHAGQVVSQVSQSDGPEVGVFDGPAIGIGGSDSHAQRDVIAFPGHDDGVQPAVSGGILLDGAGNAARGTGDRELDNFLAHGKSVLHWPSHRTSW